MEKGMVVQVISLDMIKPSKLNPRKSFDEEKIKELAASIKEKGLVNPITLRPEAGVSLAVGPYELVCGERRWKAAKMAGLKDITAIVRLLDDKQVLEFQVIENLQRADVHPLEEAEGYELLMKKHGYKTVDDLSAKVGKSKTYIYGRMKLCELIPENRKLFYEGKLTPSTALLVSRVPKDRQKEVGKEVATNADHYGDNPMTFEEAKEYIQGDFMLQMKEAQFDTKEKGLANKISCAECLKRTVNQKELFADIQGSDRCTDPGCFNAKKQAFVQRKLAELRKSGKKILAPEEAVKVLQHGYINGNYVGLNDTCYQAGSMNNRPTYYDLAKKVKDADIICALHPDSGKLVELLTKPEAARILKKLGVKTDESVATTGQKISEHKKEDRITEAKRAFWIAKIQSALDQRTKNIMLLSILSHDLGITPDDDKLLDGIDIIEDDFDEVYKLGDAQVQKIIERMLYLKPGALEDHNLDFLSTKLGFSMAKDYVITESYLQACTKDQLVALAKEIGLDKYLKERIKDFAPDLTTKKKTELIEYFMKKGFDLKGKVPKELIK